MKPGYKKTEVGAIPKEWQAQAINCVFQFKQGVQSPIEEQSKTEREGYLRFIRIIDLTNPEEEWRYIMDPGSTHHVTPFDLFMVRYGSPGLIGFGYNGVVANNLFRLMPKKDVDGLFYKQYLGDRQRDISSLSGSSTMPAVTFTALSQLYIVYPPIDEQHAIANALGDVDELLSGLDRLIAKKRDLKQAAMQQLLTGQTRLPGFHGEWETKPLSSLISEIGDGATPSTADPQNFGGGIHWVVIDDIKDDVTTTATTLTDRGLRSCAATLWQPGTLILSTGATIGEVGIARIPVATKQGICGIVFNRAEATAAFMKYWFVQNRPTLLGKAQGSTIKEVRAPTLVKLELSVPSLPEQTAIAEVLKDMDTELAALELRRQKTRALKQAMMQELLTGRIRLL